MRWLVLCALLLASFSGSTAAETGVRVAVIEPRPFGYFLGDTFKRQIEITVPDGGTLQLAGLPRPGPVNYWLQLRAVDVDEEKQSGGTRYRIGLAYQAFYSALDPRRLTVPGFTLKVAAADGTSPVHVPDWSFVMSPVRELFPGQEGGTAKVALQPDAPAPRIATGTVRTALLVSGFALLIALILLARHYARWPFHRRTDRPFTEASRFLKGHQAELAGDGGYRAALIKLHRAFDLAAGRRVLPDDVEAFVSDHPEYAPFADDIARLFAASRSTFFGGGNGTARRSMPLVDLTELGARLGAAERGAA
jgi:mxaA protein